MKKCDPHAVPPHWEHGQIPGGAQWRKRDPFDGDPSWQAQMSPLKLDVTVECPWFWNWAVWSADDIELAAGDVWVGDDYDDDDDWDYQHVEVPQARCESVARALLRDGAPLDATGLRKGGGI